MGNEKLIFYIDGASRGNPGPSGVGIVICDQDNHEIQVHKKYIGETTNNVAEYIALIIALQEAIKVRVCDVVLHTDSELIVRQIMGTYRVRDNKLKLLYALFDNLRGYFENFSVEYIDREKNKRADMLAAQAIRERK